MDSERLKIIEEIYHRALETPEDKREEFFQEHCGDDPTLRREVESLLFFEKTFDNFIDTPPESLAAEMFSEETSVNDLINKKFGHYKIISLLGRGGMGEVYLAEDMRLNRRVALKFLSAVFSSDKNRLHRFEREAFAASALNHPNILTIFEFGSENNTFFLATEYVEGETLRDILSRPELSLNEILNIIEQTAFALSAAHKAGIIHRDIKPENIMVREDGIVKVLDFGLAKLTKLESPANISPLESESEAYTRLLIKTNPGIVMGTAAYMSPEQTRGLANIDSRTDIWSLGIIMFEMLTGRIPFPGDTFSDIIASILKTEAPLLSHTITDCPSELERIVSKCLKKDPEERYQVIKDLALDLKSLKKNLEFSAEYDRITDTRERNLTMEVPASHTTIADKIKRFSVTNLLLILLAGGLVFGGAGWMYLKFGNNAERSETISTKTTEIVNWASSPGEIYSVGSFSPDAKMIAFASTKSGSKSIWVKQTSAGEAIQITRDEFINDNPTWSPDGEELAFFSTKGNQAGIWRIPKLGGSAKLIAPLDDGGSRLRYWSKSNLIYYELKNELYAVDAASGRNNQITNLKEKAINATSINISPDEKQLVYITVEDKLWSISSSDTKSVSPKKIFSGTVQIKNAVWHPDNTRIFYSAPVDGTFQIFVTDIFASPPKQLTFAEKDSFVLNVSSDGTKILFGSAKEESDIWGVNIKENKEFIVASDIDSELWAEFSPDGKSIAYQSIKNLSQGNKLFNGNLLTKVLGTDNQSVELVSNGFLPNWSPNGKNIAFLRNEGDKYQIETVNVLSGEQKTLIKDGIFPPNITVLPYNRMQTRDFSWSPDSSKIAYVPYRNGNYNIWTVNADGTNDTQLTENNDPNLTLTCPLWSADGKRIAFSTKTNNEGGKATYTINIIETETKKVDPVSSLNTFIRVIGWSQTGNELILASVEGSSVVGLPPHVILLKAQIGTWKSEEITRLNDTYLYNIHLSPDKKTIAFAAHRDGKDNIWLIPASGGEEKQTTGNSDARLYISSMAWAPDNNSIIFGKQSRYSLLSMLTNFK